MRFCFLIQACVDDLLCKSKSINDNDIYEKTRECV